jgi:hypothetical protein
MAICNWAARKGHTSSNLTIVSLADLGDRKQHQTVITGLLPHDHLSQITFSRLSGIGDRYQQQDRKWRTLL